MQDIVDKFSQRRILLMVILASTFLLWQIPRIELIENSNFGVIGERLAGISQIIWSLSMLALVVMGRKHIPRASLETQAMLEDELVKSNRAKAMGTGYFSLMVFIGLLFAITRFMEISGADLARLMMAIGVAAPLYAFAFLERRNA